MRNYKPEAGMSDEAEGDGQVCHAVGEVLFVTTTITVGVLLMPFVEQSCFKIAIRYSNKMAQIFAKSSINSLLHTENME